MAPALVLLLAHASAAEVLDLDGFSTNQWHLHRSDARHAHQSLPPQLALIKVCQDAVCRPVPPFWLAVPTMSSVTHYGYPGGNVQSTLHNRGLWDATETQVAAYVLGHHCKASGAPGGALMVDVGANTGYFSALALASGCRVHAFDGEAVHGPYWAATSQLSGRANAITFHHNLVSDNATMMQFNSWSLVQTKAGAAGNVAVQAVRLDEQIHEDVLYLKVDVEGHEPAAFRGMERLLDNHVVHVIVWEHSAHQYVSSDRRSKPPAELLKARGYWISPLGWGGMGNYVAIHPKADTTLRARLQAMKPVPRKTKTPKGPREGRSKGARSGKRASKASGPPVRSWLGDIVERIGR